MKKITTLTTLLIALLPCLSAMANHDCLPDHLFGDDTASCVTTQTHTDTVQPLGELKPGQVALYQTTKGSLSQAGDRLRRLPDVQLKPPRSTGQSTMIQVNPDKHYQRLLGFGGALTDASVLNLQKMPKVIRQAALQAYFGLQGIGYDMVRVPMAASDYSTRLYTYADQPAVAPTTPLQQIKQHFHLAPEDINGKIPLLKRIQAISSRPVKLFASPWSAPSWMKLDESTLMIGGSLNPNDYAAWAEYFRLFLQRYAQHGIHYWGVTVQNEPGDVMNFIPSMGYAYQHQDQTHDFIQQALGPMLLQYFPKLHLMVGDDEIDKLPATIDGSLKDNKTNHFISGIALHPYYEPDNWAELLDQWRTAYKDKFLLSTEYSYFQMFQIQPMGLWQAAQDYAEKMIDLMNHSVAGFVDWNMVLDEMHGPDLFMVSKTHAPMIYDTGSQLLHKTPIYYVEGQFSTFLPAGSYRVQSRVPPDQPLKVAAFITPAHNLVLVLLNEQDQCQKFDVAIAGMGTLSTEVPAKAIQTYILRLS